MEQLLALLCTPVIYAPVSAIALFSYFFNYFILKCKKEYRGLNLKAVLIMSVFPGINLVFLLLNILIFSMSAGKYRFVKVKSYAKASVSREKKPYSFGRI